MKGHMCPGDSREMFDGADSIKNEHASRKCSEDVMLRLADASLDVPGEYAAARAGRQTGGIASCGLRSRWISPLATMGGH